MAPLTTAPYGSWRSPISADMIVAGTTRLGLPQIDGDDVYWIEGRPAEGGRSVVVRRTPDGRMSDITPPDFNVRTRVHEYGGGAYLATRGDVYFANYADQRLYWQPGGRAPRPLTPAVPMRYADLILDEQRRRLICVREDHSRPGNEAANTLVAIQLPDAGGGDRADPGSILAEGYDFYASPRLSPDGTRLAWLCWRHPNMPWDGCELWVARFDSEGRLVEPVLVAGGQEEAIFQPAWAGDGSLYFVSDRSGWWNLYRRDGAGSAPLHPVEAEFGLPLWQFGMSTYAPLAGGHVVCAFCRQAIWQLAELYAASGALTPIATPYTEIEGVTASGGRAVFLAASPTSDRAVVELDLASGRLSRLSAAGEPALDPAYLSLPQPVTFQTSGGRPAHGFFYPPQNRDYAGPEHERPPLLVQIHGGPTGAAGTGLNLAFQYWTSRGFAILDVNYSGSTGYGRQYRDRLLGQWGIADVDDCCAGGRYLADQGLVDGRRLVISGSSAGGYTVLAALTFRGVFATGASRYGISDLETLATDTHKFESHYTDRLVAPYPAGRAIYYERSPIHFVNRLARPLILLQGLEDPVVPPAQATAMHEAVRAKGLPVAYLPFPGEAHGFRRAENIKRALEAEFYFYSRIFGFEPADAIEPVAIANLTDE